MSNMDHLMMDATQAATKMTGQGEVMVFNINSGTLQGEVSVTEKASVQLGHWDMVRFSRSYRPAGTDKGLSRQG